MVARHRKGKERRLAGVGSVSATMNRSPLSAYSIHPIA